MVSHVSKRTRSRLIQCFFQKVTASASFTRVSPEDGMWLPGPEQGGALIGWLLGPTQDSRSSSQLQGETLLAPGLDHRLRRGNDDSVLVLLPHQPFFLILKEVRFVTGQSAQQQASSALCSPHEVRCVLAGLQPPFWTPLPSRDPKPVRAAWPRSPWSCLQCR